MNDIINFLQNKILHSQLEALHIQWAEKERNSAGVSSGSSNADTFGDAGLQSVINYLRRSKEIVNTFVLVFLFTSCFCMFIYWFSDTVFLLSQAETEVSLLKQEKLRLQSQVKFCILICCVCHDMMCENQTSVNNSLSLFLR